MRTNKTPGYRSTGFTKQEYLMKFNTTTDLLKGACVRVLGSEASTSAAKDLFLSIDAYERSISDISYGIETSVERIENMRKYMKRDFSSYVKKHNKILEKIDEELKEATAKRKMNQKAYKESLNQMQALYETVKNFPVSVRVDVSMEPTQ